MKKELKISTLSIVCVLCTTIAMPSFGASAVRSIGGAGTYSSASSAATAGSKTSSGSTNSVRAGSLRSTGGKAATSSSASSTRAAATPRLSIGKYLAGSSAVSAGTSSGSANLGQSGFKDLGDRVEKLEFDVERLQKDIGVLTGEYPAIEFEDGVLIMVQDGKTEKIDLNDYFASEDGLKALEDRVNALVIPSIDGLVTREELEDLEKSLQDAIADKQDAGDYAAADALTVVSNELAMLTADVYTKAQVDAIVAKAVSDGQVDLSGYATTSALEALTALVSANAASVADVKTVADSAKSMADQNAADIIALQGKGYITSGALTEYAKRTELAAVATSGSYNDLRDKPEIPSIDGLATTEALNTLQSTLQAAIDEKQASGDYATAEALAAVVADVEALKGESASDEVIQQLNERVNAIAADYATDSEVQTAVEAVKALIPSLDGYVKSDDLAAVATSGSYNDLSDTPDLTQYVTETQVEQSVNTAINAYEIPDGSITAEKIQNGAVTSEKINTEAAAGEMVMLMSNGDGTSSWVSVTVDAE